MYKKKLSCTYETNYRINETKLIRQESNASLIKLHDKLMKPRVSLAKLNVSLAKHKELLY